MPPLFPSPHPLHPCLARACVRVCSAKVLRGEGENVSYICSRYYRAPELILEAKQYTCAVGSSRCTLLFLYIICFLVLLFLYCESSFCFVCVSSCETFCAMCVLVSARSLAIFQCVIRHLVGGLHHGRVALGSPTVQSAVGY